MILDFDSKITIESMTTSKDILTINDLYDINIKKAILLDGDEKRDWKKLKKDESIFPIVPDEIYIVANKYLSADEEKDIERDKDKQTDNLYYISDISYDTDNSKKIRLVSGKTAKIYPCTVDLKNYNCGDLVLATIETGKVTKLERATSKKYNSLNVDRELILDYEGREHVSGMFGKYKIDKNTEIYLLNKKYKTNVSNEIEKCTIEKVNESELDYVDEEIVNIIADANLAKTIYIERETNKFDVLYARVEKITTEKGEIVLSITPIDGVPHKYKAVGRVNCDEDDLISYRVEKEDIIRIEEVYRKEVIGYTGDLVVKKIKNDTIILANGEEFEKKDNSINVNGKRYKISNYLTISGKVRNNSDGWYFASLTFSEFSKVKFNVGDRIAIDELEGVIMIYSGYDE